MAERGTISRPQLYDFGTSSFGFDKSAEDTHKTETNSPWNLLSLVGDMPGSKVAEKTAPVTEKTNPTTEKTAQEKTTQDKTLPVSEKQTPPASEKTPPAIEKTAPPAEKTTPAKPAEGDGHHHKRKHESTAKADLKKELPDLKNLRDGDIIFVSNGAFDEGKAIQLVSKSPLTHCGILFKEGDEWFVYEAVQPVKKTPLKELHKPDSGETYAVRRLKNADEVLTKDTLEKLHSSLKKNEGKDYDTLFGWGNDKMYCSELVWKAYYEATRLKIGKIQMVGDYDLSDPLVKKMVEARYGKDVPLTEPTITPGAVFDSRLLKTIK